MSTLSTVPVLLFAYARPDHLRRVLACLAQDQIPLLYAFADAPKNAADAERCAAVRQLLHAVDFCELKLEERSHNLGLGRSLLQGISQVAARHESFIVWEDDLVCVPGTYSWLCGALAQYATQPRVMSVTAWSHPSITPPGLADQPYFDARAECWVWGSWARAWRGMGEQNALQKLHAVRQRGLSPDAYGADLPRMAHAEQAQNLWAVRWLYHHLQHAGLCLRPPWSLVEHIGFDSLATNAKGTGAWHAEPLRPAPPIPQVWPPALEHPGCQELWQRAFAEQRRFSARRVLSKVKHGLKSLGRLAR